jgi:NTP pyrophosphatase (non-canonical NTP hydrolase)
MAVYDVKACGSEFRIIVGERCGDGWISAAEPEAITAIKAFQVTEKIVSESYQQQALRTEAPCDLDTLSRLDNNARRIHALVGLSTEVGELTDIWKKYVFYGKPIDVTNAKEEVGDILWYLAILCDSLGTTIEAEMSRNIAKLKTRYPDKFTEQAAAVRDLDKERQILDGAAEQDLESRR